MLIMAIQGSCDKSTQQRDLYIYIYIYIHMCVYIKNKNTWLQHVYALSFL